MKTKQKKILLTILAIGLIYWWWSDKEKVDGYADQGPVHPEQNNSEREQVASIDNEEDTNTNKMERNGNVGQKASA